MRFVCNQQVLAKALNIVLKAVTPRTTIPILKGLLLTVDNNGILKMIASDMDLSIERKIQVHSAEEGSIVVSAKLFNDIIRKLPNDDVEVTEENNTVTIRCLSSEFTIVGQPAEEFPSIGTVNSDERIKFDKAAIKEMIKKTSFSASIEESKGIIVGILIEMEDDYLSMVALDGFRMAVTKEKKANNDSKKIVISAKIMNEIYKIFTETVEDEDVEMILDDKKAVFLMEDTKIVSRIMEGEFIKYKGIIPKEYSSKLIIDRLELLDSIERASLLAREGRNNLVKLSLEEDGLVITSSSEEGNVIEKVNAHKEGNDLLIGFNAKYIIDALKVIDDEEIVMEFGSNVNPCLIKPIEGDQFLYLILPVRIAA